MKQIKNLTVVMSLILVPALSFAAGTTETKTAKTMAKTETQASSSLEKDFDSLGGNRILLDKANAINPEVRTKVVQNRIVDRTSRFEFNGSYANTFGGDTYVRTGTFSLGTQYHINNHWSVGAKYGMSFNKLTNEGEDLVKRAEADHIANPSTSKSPVPDIDYPKSQMMGFVNFYPLYGKMSWFGNSISHFDVYGQLGYGQVGLDSGSANAMSGGVGISVWVNNNITTRLEAIYTNYEAQYSSGPIQQDITSASIQIGWLL